MQSTTRSKQKQPARAMSPRFLPPQIRAMIADRLARAATWPSYPHLSRARFATDLDALLATIDADPEKIRPAAIAAFEIGMGGGRE